MLLVESKNGSKALQSRDNSCRDCRGIGKGTNEYALIHSPAQTRNTCAPRLKRSVLLQTREVFVGKNALILATNTKRRATGTSC